MIEMKLKCEILELHKILKGSFYVCFIFKKLYILESLYEMFAVA